MQNIIIVLLISIIVLNIYATLALFSSYCYETQQKWLQLLLVWALPIIGAILVLSLAKDSKIKTVKISLGSSDLTTNMTLQMMSAMEALIIETHKRYC